MLFDRIIDVKCTKNQVVIDFQFCQDSQKKLFLQVLDLPTLSIKDLVINLGDGKKYQFSLLDNRYCLGYYDLKLRKKIFCKDNSITKRSNLEQCYECMQKNQFNPFFYNTSQDDISSEQKERNNLPHSVYLASFGKKLIKVGITKTGRELSRAVEQGAISYAIIKKAENAYQARELESFINKQYEIPENISTLKKINALKIYSTDYSSAEKEIKVCLDKIKKDATFLDMKPYYSHLKEYDFAELEVLPKEAIGHLGKVEIEGIIGNALMCKKSHSNNAFAFNLKALLGIIAVEVCD